MRTLDKVSGVWYVMRVKLGCTLRRVNGGAYFYARKSQTFGNLKGGVILLAHPSHMTKKQIYKDPRYLRARAAALARDKYLCQECRRYGRTTPAQTAHHIKHVEDYPELAFDENNLKSVCWSCHNKEHPEKGGNRGRGSRSRNRGDYE